MTLLTRETAMKNNRFEMVEVDVTEWGSIDPETGKPEKTTVFVRELSSREKDLFEESLMVGTGKKRHAELQGLKAKLAIMVCCNEDQSPIFSKDDFEWFSQKSAMPIERIFEAANKLNKVIVIPAEEEETLKN